VRFQTAEGFKTRPLCRLLLRRRCCCGLSCLRGRHHSLRCRLLRRLLRCSRLWSRSLCHRLLCWCIIRRSRSLLNRSLLCRRSLLLLDRRFHHRPCRHRPCRLLRRLWLCGLGPGGHLILHLHGDRLLDDRTLSWLVDPHLGWLAARTTATTSARLEFDQHVCLRTKTHA
jgi:hypothetical protein